MLRPGGLIQICEAAIFHAAESFHDELKIQCPRCLCLQHFADTLMAALDTFAGIQVRSLRICGVAVEVLRIVALLSKAFLLTCVQNKILPWLEGLSGSYASSFPEAITLD